MGFLDLFSETPDVLKNITNSFSGKIPLLIGIILLIGVIYWLRSLQRAGHTEIRVYRRP